MIINKSLDVFVVMRFVVANYHLPIGHLAFSRVVFNFIKHPHFLHWFVLFLKNSQLLQILRRDRETSSGDFGEPLIKSQGLTSSELIKQQPILALVW